MLAKRPYSCLRQSRRRSSPFANAASRAIYASLTSGGRPPRTPIPFIRLCRPRANGRNPQRDSIAVLTALQLSHASHAHRDVPPAVALKQTMHRSRSCETSQPAHFSGESSSLHDCHRTGRCGWYWLLRCSGPHNPPHGMCTDSSVIRSRSAASAALRFRSVILATPGDAAHGRPPLARLRAGSSPGAPSGGRAVAGTAGQVPVQPSARELITD
jgi:hypothetical protein